VSLSRGLHLCCADTAAVAPPHGGLGARPKVFDRKKYIDSDEDDYIVRPAVRPAGRKAIRIDSDGDDEDNTENRPPSQPGSFVRTACSESLPICSCTGGLVKVKSKGSGSCHVANTLVCGHWFCL